MAARLQNTGVNLELDIGHGRSAFQSGDVNFTGVGMPYEHLSAACQLCGFAGTPIEKLQAMPEDGDAPAMAQGPLYAVECGCAVIQGYAHVNCLLGTLFMPLPD